MRSWGWVLTVCSRRRHAGRPARRWGAAVAAAGLLVATLVPVSRTGAQTPPPSRTPASLQATALPAEGYRAVAGDGGVFDFGTNRFLGSRWSLGIKTLAAPISGMAPTPDGLGYWLVGRDGGILSFGDAAYRGSLPGLHVIPAAPIVGIAATHDGGGYWLVGADGGVLSFGDAGYYGSLPGSSVVPASPIVAIAATPDGRGYWLAGADGGVFAFGDAHFFGSLGSTRLAAPIVGMTSAFTGSGSSGQHPGYWLVGRDGGVFAFGAPFHGSLPGLEAHTTSIGGITATVDNGGYWIGTADGTVYTFGDAPFLGDFHTQAATGGAPHTTLIGLWVGLSTVAPPGATAISPHVVLSYAPGTSASQQVGTTATFDVTVTLAGRPDSGARVTVRVSGANPSTLPATANSSGVATIHYSGAASGTDTIVASSGTGTSNALHVTWTEPLASAATSQVAGNFFAEPAGTSTFVAKPGDTPAFGQTFPDIAFNPPQGLLPIPPGAPSPVTVPFTDVLTDAGGAYAGVLPAKGNGYQAGAGTTAGDLTNFDAVFRGTLNVAKAGYLTLGVIAADGFIFGASGGATRLSGVMQGAPASGTSPFATYPLMATNNACLPTSVGGNPPQPGDFPVTIHLPKAGAYPYEVDYFSCNTTSNQQPLRSMVLRAESFSTTAPTAPTVYLGYADLLRLPNNEFHYFPYPWGGSPGVQFDSPCGTGCSWDGDAVRFDNTTAQPMTFASLMFNIAPHSIYESPFTSGGQTITVPPGGTVVLADNYDTSDYDGVYNCTRDGFIPTITATINGTPETYTDSTQVLNTGGFDPPNCGPSYKWNESTPWTRVGGPGTGADVPLPPIASLTLAPIAAVGGGPLTDEVGTTQPFTVAATGSNGSPISGLPVTLVVVGTNPQRLQATTDAAGVAHFSYGGLAAGNDTLAASANDQGLELASGQTTVTWQIPVPGGAPSGGTPAQAPPTISISSLPAGTSITQPTPVTATITPVTGQTITSWSVQLTPASSGQGSTPVTLASGTTNPPATLATIDPTRIVDGTYNLSVTATASGGGSITHTEEIVVAGGFKPGRYEATYQDLTFPAPGFTVGVQRVYDSIDKAVGDFGVGWRLQLADWSAGVSGPLGAGGWTASATSCSLFGCQYQFNSSTPHTVTLTDPTGTQQVFDLTPSGGGGPLYFLAGNPATFTAAPGSVGTLSVYQDPGLYYGFDGNLYNAELAGSGIYSPTEFVYTQPNGTQLLLSTTAGLLDELQPDGNCLDFSSAGVRSYTGATSLAGCGGGAQGPSLTINRDGSGRVTSIVTPAGATYSYSYDADGNLVTVTPPAPTGPDTYTYDANHDMLTQTGPGTPLTTLTYDGSGRLTKVTDAAGHTTTITNDLGQHQQIVSDANGQLSTVYTYNANGNLVRQDRIAGATTLTDSWTYDALGNPTSHTDPNGHTTTSAYSASSDMTSFSDANGHTTHLSYNSLGEITSETNPAGAVVYTATYNPQGELLTSAGPGGAVTTYTYTSDGQVATQTDPDGKTTTYSYNSAGNVTSISDAAGHTTTMSYDSLGDLTASTDGNGHTTGYTYDSEGRLLTITDGDGHVTTTYAYTPWDRSVPRRTATAR